VLQHENTLVDNKRHSQGLKTLGEGLDIQGEGLGSEVICKCLGQTEGKI